MILRRLATGPVKAPFKASLGLLLATALTLTACSPSNEPPPSAGGDAELGATNDINPQDPAMLQDGGTLRLALSGFPPNFNTMHIDGNLGELGSMLRPTMPRAFVIAPDGTRKVVLKRKIIRQRRLGEIPIL